MAGGKKRTLSLITAKSFGTEYDPETRILFKKKVVVTQYNFGKAWVSFSWKNLDEFKHDLALDELKSSEMYGEMDFDESKSQGAELEISGAGAQALEDNGKFQKMLEEEWCGDLFDYCLTHGKDVWDAMRDGVLPKDYDQESIPEGEYVADRIRIYDIKATWSDGTSDLFTLNEEIETSEKNTAVHLFDSHDGCLQGFLEFV